MAPEARPRCRQRNASLYCLVCLAPAHDGQSRCSRCGTAFTGAGRYNLVDGPLPSPEFAFLFGRSDGEFVGGMRKAA